jgi:DNA-directed RNA polymerase specialized sigma24 family protein
MFYIKDMSYDEIVEATQVTIGTIKGQLNRARKLLQTEFGNL